VRKDIKKLIVPVAALLAVICQEFFGLDIASDQWETVLNVGIMIALAVGVMMNPDKRV